jgi:hypothetical protein
VGGGGGVDHHLVGAGAARQAHHLEQGEQLVGAGHRQGEQAVDVGEVEVGALLRDAAEGLAAALQPAAVGGRGGELDGAQLAGLGSGSGDGQRPRLWAERGAEGVAEGVGGIGRDGEDAAAAAGAGQRPGGGAGGLADAALAAEETVARGRAAAAAAGRGSVQRLPPSPVPGS